MPPLAMEHNDHATFGNGEALLRLDTPATCKAEEHLHFSGDGTLSSPVDFRLLEWSAASAPFSKTAGSGLLSPS